MSVIHIPRRHYAQPQGQVQIAPEWDTAVTAWSGHAPTDNAGRGGLFIPQSAALVSSVSRSGLGVRSTAYSSKGWLQGRIGNPATENWPGVTLALDVVMSADAGDFPALLSFMPVGEFYGAWNLAAENVGVNRYFLIRIGDSGAGTGLSGGSWGSGIPANEWAPGDHFRIVISHDRAGSIDFFWEKNGVHGSRSRNDATNGWRSGTSVENIGGYERSGFRSSPHTISFAAVLPHPIAEERARSLLNNPWQLFRADPIRIYSLPSGPITLAASGSASASGSAAIGLDIALAGVGVALATGTATAAGSAALAATGAAAASGAAAPSVQIALSALGLSVATGTAAVSSAASGELAAGGAASASGSAALAANVTISAAGLAQAAGAAGVSAAVLLAGAGAAQAAGNATLAAELRALAAGAAQASGTATINGAAAGELSAHGTAQSLGTAALVLDVRLAAAGAAQGSGSATAGGGTAQDLAAGGAAQASGAGAVTAIVVLTAAGFVQAMGAGSLVLQVPLAATGAAAASGSATAVDAEALVLIYNPAFEVSTPGRRFEVSRR